MKTSHFSTAEIKEILAERGIKVTAQRIAVCSYVLCDGCHVSAEQIKAQMDKDFPLMSLATVYNTLHILTEAGILKAIKMEDSGKVLYDNNLHPHYHFLNQETGELMDIHPEDISIELKHPEKYNVKNIDLVLSGKVVV